MTVRKFIDDNLQIEKINMAIQRTYIENDVIYKNPRLARSERMFKHIARNACEWKKDKSFSGVGGQVI